jgi:RNA-directed DNA polymerase
MNATARHISGGAGWWKSPCPDLARAWARKLAQATQQAQVSGGVADGSEEGLVMRLERSSDVVPTEGIGQPGNGEEPARSVKPFGIAKRVVWEAYRHVKANRGAAGIDGESIEMFEANLKDNLYRRGSQCSAPRYTL